MIVCMFSNGRKGRKTNNMTLNTNLLGRKKYFLYRKIFFMLPPRFPHFLLPFAANSFIWEKGKLTYLTLIWGNGNYLIYFGSTAINFSYGVR